MQTATMHRQTAPADSLTHDLTERANDQTRKISSHRACDGKVSEKLKLDARAALLPRLTPSGKRADAAQTSFIVSLLTSAQLILLRLQLSLY